MTCTRPRVVIMYERHRKQQRPSDVEASAGPIHIARQRHGLSPLHVPEEPNKSQQKSAKVSKKSKTSAWFSPHTTKPLSTLSGHASKRPTTCSRIAAVRSNLLPGLRVAPLLSPSPFQPLHRDSNRRNRFLRSGFGPFLRKSALSFNNNFSTA